MTIPAAPEATLAPIPTGLSTLVSTDFWDESQWEVFFSVMEAVLPAVASQSTITDKHNQIRITDAEFEDIYKRLSENVVDAPSKEALRGFLAERFTDNPEHVETCKRMLSSFPPEKNQQLGSILRILKYVCRVDKPRGSHNSLSSKPRACRWFLTDSPGTGLAHISSLDTAPLLKTSQYIQGQRCCSHGNLRGYKPCAS